MFNTGTIHHIFDAFAILIFYSWISTGEISTINYPYYAHLAIQKGWNHEFRYGVQHFGTSIFEFYKGVWFGTQSDRKNKIRYSVPNFCLVSSSHHPLPPVGQRLGIIVSCATDRMPGVIRWSKENDFVRLDDEKTMKWLLIFWEQLLCLALTRANSGTM